MDPQLRAVRWADDDAAIRKLHAATLEVPYPESFFRTLRLSRRALSFVAVARPGDPRLEPVESTTSRASEPSVGMGVEGVELLELATPPLSASGEPVVAYITIMVDPDRERRNGMYDPLEVVMEAANELASGFAWLAGAAMGAVGHLFTWEGEDGAEPGDATGEEGAGQGAAASASAGAAVAGAAGLEEAEAGDAIVLDGPPLDVPDAKMAYVMTLGVHPSFRRAGVARALLAAAFRAAHALLDADAAKLHCLPSNRAGVRLYNSLGFKRVSVRESYYELGGKLLDGWEMQAALPLPADSQAGVADLGASLPSHTPEEREVADGLLTA